MSENEGALILLLLAGAGGLGWWLWSRHQVQQAAVTAMARRRVAPAAPKKVLFSDWNERLLPIY